MKSRLCGHYGPPQAVLTGNLVFLASDDLDPGRWRLMMGQIILLLPHLPTPSSLVIIERNQHRSFGTFCLSKEVSER